jgi:hypothetical protein
MCGCGGTTSKASRALIAQRVEKGHHRQYMQGHSPSTTGQFSKGHRPANYNGGLTFHRPTGRWKIVCRDGTRVAYYRAVMEADLRRPLRPEEVVHHLNGDSTDDRIENLQLLSGQGEHVTLHAAQRRSA